MILSFIYILVALGLKAQCFFFQKPCRLQTHSIKMSIEDTLAKFIEEDRKWKAGFTEKYEKDREKYEKDRENYEKDRKKDEKWKMEQKRERKELLAAVKKIDIIYENIVRQELVQSRGSDFGRPFKITNLWGLARVALPKEKTLSPIEGIKKKAKPLSKNKVIKVDPSSYAILHKERTEKLAKVALVHLPGLVQWAEQNSNSTVRGASKKLGLFNLKPTRPINRIKRKQAE